jgi:hypothetical protein
MLEVKLGIIEIKPARVEADYPFDSKSIYFRNTVYWPVTIDAKVINGD